jgi:DegV family protein with EDD domain
LDSLSGALGEGLLVLKAAALKQAGGSLNDVSQTITDLRTRTHHWFTVDDWGPMVRGGRCPSIVGKGGAALNVKPILRVNYNGEIVLSGIARGRAKSLKRIVSEIVSAVSAEEAPTVGISHTNAAEKAQEVADNIKALRPETQFVIEELGPTIGTFTGENAIGLFAIGSPR